MSSFPRVQECDVNIPWLGLKGDMLEPLLMWMHEQVRAAAARRAMSLSTWPAAPACAQQHSVPTGYNNNTQRVPHVLQHNMRDQTSMYTIGSRS